MTIGMAAAVAGMATLVAIQQGLIGTGRSPVSNPLPSISEAAGQGATEKAGTRRKAEAEAAAAGEGRRAVAEAVAAEARREAQAEAATADARGMVMAEAAAAEERREAQAEAATAEARGMAMTEASAAEEWRRAQAEAVAEPKRRKKAEAGRRRMAVSEEAERPGRAVAETAPRQFDGSGPIMHGISK